MVVFRVNYYDFWGKYVDILIWVVGGIDFILVGFIVGIKNDYY